MKVSCPLVFIIDDDVLYRKRLSKLVRQAGYTLESFPSAAAFLARARYEGVGCILLDLRMPEMDGLELQEKLAAINFPLPIIFVTGHGDVASSVQAMKRGAVDFLTKPVPRMRLLQAIDTALQRSAEVRQQHDRTQRIRRQLSGLTPREYEVLTLVIRGMRNKQIAHRLGIAEKTVKVHRGRVMEKLDVASVAELVRLCEDGQITKD
ncbi:MAG: response regulator transcription factor [Candidatus Hydrogenedentes bacterium]|nr:response regulator transcription factor [Candidatus Hydrogenedentota bacterium]